MSDVLEFALRYAGRGYRVLPLHRIVNGKCTCGKQCDSPGKHPRTAHGVKDATTDEATIRAWWKRWPTANIGMALDGHVVVDVDPRNGGDCDEWQQKLPDTSNQRTGGGGMHFLFRAINGTRYAKPGAPGVDIKQGDSEYIVVEPSIHPSGEKYVWIDETEPWGMQPTDAPAWLAQQQHREARSDGPSVIREGGRNAHLTSLLRIR